MTLLEFAASILVISLIVVLFGASIFDAENVILLSTFLSIICLMPLFVIIDHTNPIDLLFRIFIKQELNDSFEVKCLTIAKGTVLGAWLGSLVIPLDWDRWWQIFPIPNLIAAILGALVSSLTLLINFNKSKLKAHY